MDATSLFIIVVTTVTAIAFKWFLFQRIRQWMDVDLIRGLAEGDPARQAQLETRLAQLKAEGVPRKQQHQQLEAMAATFEQKL